MMNISYFLRPKVTVTYLTDDCPVRQALDDMLKSGFTAVPVVSPKGKYIGTVNIADTSREELSRLWRCDTTFAPAMDARHRERLLADWHRAVERCRGWARENPT